MNTLAVPAEPRSARSVRIEVADNGYVVYIEDGGPDYKSTKLVFTGQAAMLKAIKEATSVKRDEE